MTNDANAHACPKCGYFRRATDKAPDWQCPSCGIAYAKYTPALEAQKNHHGPRPPDNTEFRDLEEFQRRVREFWPRFVKTVVLGAFPGVGLVMIDGERLLGSPLTIIGLVVFLVAFARAIYVWQRYLRCPACDAVQWQLGGWQFPYHVCAECGARLSRGTLWME